MSFTLENTQDSIAMFLHWSTDHKEFSRTVQEFSKIILTWYLSFFFFYCVCICTDGAKEKMGQNACPLVQIKELPVTIAFFLAMHSQLKWRCHFRLRLSLTKTLKQINLLWSKSFAYLTVVWACNLRTQEAEIGRSKGQGQLELHEEPI